MMVVLTRRMLAMLIKLMEMDDDCKHCCRFITIMTMVLTMAMVQVIMMTTVTMVIMMMR